SGRQRAERHWPRDWSWRTPGCAAVNRRDETDIQCASRSRAVCLGIVVIAESQVRRAAAGCGIDTEAWNEVIYCAGERVNWNPGRRRPGCAIARRAHNQVIRAAVCAEAAVLPYDINRAGRVHSRRGKSIAAQASRN